MARPGSTLTAFRVWLAARIDPQPDPGEGWCMRCSMNGGRTLVLSADGTHAHARDHQDSPDEGQHFVSVRARWSRT
jgi:hypothetical protein